MRKIVSSNLQLPQRVWASAQQSLSKFAFAFALHHSCTLPEPTLDTTRRLQVYPRDSTKTPPTASIERGVGNASFCRRQKVGLPAPKFLRAFLGLLMKKIFTINGSNFFLMVAKLCCLVRKNFFPHGGTNFSPWGNKKSWAKRTLFFEKRAFSQKDLTT